MHDIIIGHVLNLMNHLCVIMLTVYVLGQIGLFSEIVSGNISYKKRILVVLIFNLFSLYAAVAGGHANIRVLGPFLAGIVGGPAVGISSAIVGGLYRYFDIRYTVSPTLAVSALLATFLAGLIGGLIHNRKQGASALKISETALYAALYEVLYLAITIAINGNQPAIMEIVKQVAIPMALAHIAGTAFFVYMVNNLIREHKIAAANEQAQRELCKSELWFIAAFNASPNPMAICTLDGRYVAVNNSFISLTGFSHGELIDHTPAELGIWPDADSANLILNALRQQKSWRDYEAPIRTKFGKERTVLLYFEPISVQDERYALKVMVDITERKRIEQELSRLDRLNLVGQMAAGVAHEIRNPMTTVRGFLQFFGTKKDLGPYHDNIEMMIQELDRVDALIKEYISLARNKAISPRRANLNSILSAIAPLIQASALLQDKYLVINLGSTTDIMIDEKEIRQLILNLARNGLESMSGKGMLCISTYLDAGDVILAVRDQGNGMDKKVLSQIGTPFFTTKEEGTGLGLAICYSIAERHKAIITVETSPAGTTFFVRFGGLDTTAPACPTLHLPE